MIKITDIFSDFPEQCPDLSDLIVHRTSADSRKISKGDIFIAIKGTQNNGTQYIQSAIDQGAFLIIGETKPDFEISVPFYQVANARKALTDILAALYPKKPENMYAVTGTNGKTSIADFMRQIIDKHLKRSVASIGTLGVITGSHVPDDVRNNMPYKIIHTTPDPEILYPTLHYLADNGVTDCIIEASSHGLSQYRFGEIQFDCVLFSNFSRDHLDYHQTEAAYFDAKMMLFNNHTHKKTHAIIFSDDARSAEVINIAKKNFKAITTIGHSETNDLSDYIISDFMPHHAGSDFMLAQKNKKSTAYKTNLVGQFQINNLTMALLAVKALHKIRITQKIINHVGSVDGRLDFIASHQDAGIYVDYAHTPDALEKAILALKRHCTGRLICVFGCGGNRDIGKRPIMGKIVAELADFGIITDDNPRFEDPSSIREDILAGITSTSKAEICTIADRKEAINHAISLLQNGDILLIAGKGHEDGQIICDKTLPFKDASVIRDIIEGGLQNNQATPKTQNLVIENKMENEKQLLWTQAGICATTDGSVVKPFNVTGIAIDSREVQEGDLFIALKSKRDGHYFIKNAAQNGAVAALIAWKPRNIPRGFPVVYVKNTLGALEGLAKGARSRMRGKVIAITGTVGKTSTKEILGQILSQQGKTHASVKSFNNHIGVPLTLARMPADTEYGVFEIGMNHAGEISTLVKMVRPDIALITTVGNGHREAFDSLDDIARAKAEITDGVKQGGTVILNRDIETYSILHETAQAHELNIVTFGQHQEAHIRLHDYQFNETDNQATFKITDNAQEYTVQTGLKGIYNAMNICGIIGVVKSAGADINQAIEALKEIKPHAGRGETLSLTLPEDKGTITVVDESYNANPLSMQAVLDNMVTISPQKEGKKIAVLGAMYELGDITQQAHIDLKEHVVAGNYDAIYLIGNEMSALYDVLGDDQPAVLAENIDDIADEIIQETVDGSVIVMKGSNGTKLWQLVTKFKQYCNFFENTHPTEDNEENDETTDSITPEADDVTAE